MAVHRSLLILAFSSCVFSKERVFMEENLVKEICSKTDIECLNEVVTTYIQKTSNGLPEYGIQRVDPLILPELDDVVNEEMGLLFKFKNLNITGLKNQQTIDYQIDTDKRFLGFKTKGDLDIVANLTLAFTKEGKSYNGLFTASTTAVISSYFYYTLMKKGDEQYFVLGPATIIGEIIGEPNVTIELDLQSALDIGLDTRALLPDSDKNTLRKQTLKKIVETAYVPLLQNIIVSTNYMPTNGYFKDLP